MNCNLWNDESEHMCDNCERCVAVGEGLYGDIWDLIHISDYSERVKQFKLFLKLWGVVE